MFMDTPEVINSNHPNKDYVLFLQKNLYGQKQANRLFYLYLREGLEKIGFQGIQII